MKRLVISLGSLSLVFITQAHTEDVDPMTSMTAPLTELTSEASSEDTLSSDDADDDDFAFLENDPSELEQELISLEKELDNHEKEPTLSTEAAPVAQETAPDRSEQNVVQAVDPVSADVEVLPTQSPDEMAAIITEEVKTESDTQTVVSSTTNEEQPIAQEKTASPSLVTQNDEQEQTLSLSNDELTEDADVDALTIEKELSSSTKLAESEENSASNEVSVETNVTESPSIAEASMAKSTPIASAALTAPAATKIEISLKEVLGGSPWIYLTLMGLSVASLAIWLFNFLLLRKQAGLSDTLLKNVRNKLVSSHYEEAVAICKGENNFFSSIMASGISSRRYGLQFMVESMKSEGKRMTVPFWQRLSLLQDIAIIAPMLGLLGTVLGMFYAFYDLNRSFESISTLFDGLGVSVGTTVAGIFVAILAMVLHSIAKFRLVKSLSRVESEAMSLAHLIDSHSHRH